MSIKDILKIPYIMFVIGMLDAPQIDYEESREKDNEEKIYKPKTAEEEAAAFTKAFM